MALVSTDFKDLDPRLLQELRNALSLKEVKLVITSAYPLKVEEIEKIKQKLGLSNEKALNVINDVDQKIIGGLIIKFGENYFDYSIKGRLDELQANLNL